ncbi:MAG: hypothetical protein P1U81_16695 [Verrucomicrobiales bacterium]|nr:hypothetical protein [Verrucomicrobiales bacterium]
MNNLPGLFTFGLLALFAFPGEARGSLILLQDDFSGGSVTPTFRIYENTIDDGLHKSPNSYGGQPASAWIITGGRVENASSLAAKEYPNSKEAEAPVYNFFSGTPTTDTMLILEFDYSVSAGDTLYVHFWGMTGTSDDDAEFVSNIEGNANGAVNLNGNTTELMTYNLRDGAASGFGATSLSGALTGSGSFSAAIRVGSLGISGVNTVGDLDYYLIQFAKNEDGTAGTTWIDNFRLTSTVPEPSTAGILGLLFSSLILGRERRKLANPQECLRSRLGPGPRQDRTEILPVETDILRNKDTHGSEISGSFQLAFRRRSRNT